MATKNERVTLPDDYRVLWTDQDGDRLCIDDDGFTMSDERGPVEAVYLPTSPADCDRLLTDLAAEMGREPCEGGFRAKPRPFRVGDVVRCNNGPAFTAFTVLHVGSERLFVVAEDAHEYAIEHHRCTLITPAEEVEQGEVEQSEGEWRTPEEHELADAKRAGVLQIDDGTDDWPESCRSPEDFELHGFDGYPRSAYRVPAGWNR